MDLVCLDLEGVLVPEIWITFAEKTGVSELRLTTRDVPDYDELMQYRLSILERERFTLSDITSVIASIDPLPGAEEFLAALRRGTQFIILSDTFVQFAGPLMEKLGHPTILCNDLESDEEGRITGYRLRQKDGKRRAVGAFAGLGLTVTAVGDSYNDIAMLQEAHRAALFRPPASIGNRYPEFPRFTEYGDLLRFLLPEPTHAVRARYR